MANDDIYNELSLDSLRKLVDTKANKNHTHTFLGNITSALSLNGIGYDKFVRNNIKDQKIQAYYDNVSFGVASNNTVITLASGDNRANLVVNNENLLTNNFTISGPQEQEVVCKIVGQLLINDSRVMTLNDKDQITGIDLSDLQIQGKGILLDTRPPLDTEDGTVWGKILDEDLVEDNTAVANHSMYTLPVGVVVKTLSNTVPNGYVRANGQELVRNAYIGLWNFVKANCTLVPETQWQEEYANNKLIQKYSYGDGSATFRVPNMPTDDNTMYIIKAYDELCLRDMPNLAAMQKEINDLSTHKAVSGVGYCKFCDGGLIQYGTVKGTACDFSIPFVDDKYTIIANCFDDNGVALLASVDITHKAANRCPFVIVNRAGATISSATINYIAIGRWE